MARLNLANLVATAGQIYGASQAGKLAGEQMRQERELQLQQQMLRQMALQQQNEERVYQRGRDALADQRYLDDRKREDARRQEDYQRGLWDKTASEMEMDARNRPGGTHVGLDAAAHYRRTGTLPSISGGIAIPLPSGLVGANVTLPGTPQALQARMGPTKDELNDQRDAQTKRLSDQARFNHQMAVALLNSGNARARAWGSNYVQILRELQKTTMSLDDAMAEAHRRTVAALGEPPASGPEAPAEFQDPSLAPTEPGQPGTSLEVPLVVPPKKEVKTPGQMAAEKIENDRKNKEGRLTLDIRKAGDLKDYRYKMAQIARENLESNKTYRTRLGDAAAERAAAATRNAETAFQRLSQVEQKAEQSGVKLDTQYLIGLRMREEKVSTKINDIEKGIREGKIADVKSAWRELHGNDGKGGLYKNLMGIQAEQTRVITKTTEREDARAQQPETPAQAIARYERLVGRKATAAERRNISQGLR